MKDILQKIQSVKAAVIGDFCLDVYWVADMTKSELSRETPHFPLPIVEERMSPGGAGNVVCNLCALRPADVRCIGDFGKDWRGDVLSRLLQEAGAKTDGVFFSDRRKTNRSDTASAMSSMRIRGSISRITRILQQRRSNSCSASWTPSRRISTSSASATRCRTAALRPPSDGRSWNSAAQA